MKKGVLQKLKLGTYMRLLYVTLNGDNHIHFLQDIIIYLFCLSVSMINITIILSQTA